MIPVRPKESVLEKRELAKFPQITVSGVLDGSYFSDISTWYSDSYPLRDVWMSRKQCYEKALWNKNKADCIK